MSEDRFERAGVVTIIGWACFLACSWTWCIGMWLPVLMHRDYGPSSFYLFAIPNCLGAAAFGWFLRRPGASAAFVKKHAFACRLFSAVTLAFQWFFLIVALTNAPTMALKVGLLAAAIVMLSLIESAARGTTARVGVVSVLAYLGSLAMLGWWLKETSGSTPIQPVAVNARPERLPFVGAACFVGFTLCPYLDLSFHDARRRLAGGRGTTAFLLGFVVLFALLITFTHLYAPSIIAEQIRTGLNLGPGLAHWAVLVHIALQLGFTIGIHDGWLGDRSSELDGKSLPWLRTAGFIVGALLGVGSLWMNSYNDYSAREMIYRGFMGFYALVFPAYVTTCVIPMIGRDAPVRARHVAIWIATCIVGAPAFWMGFIEHHEEWLFAGVGVVILACIPAWVARPPLVSHAEG